MFQYIGKHRIQQRKVVVDERLAALLREIKTIGGPKLFEYLDADGRVHAVTPRDVNAYIKSLAGPDFSAKDFRTWGGTLLAAIALAELGPPASATAARRNIAQAVRQVAARLGNTPTVCRGSYIHPAVFELYQRGVTLDQVRPRDERTVQRHAPEYELEEIALLRLFRAA